jgi:AcrR family transcriptional regulator
MNATTQQETRARLLEVAAELFWERGYEGTGVAQILKDSGVNAGSMYHFFRNKEELLIGVLERYRELLWPEVMQRAHDATDDPVERVFVVMDGYRMLLTEFDYRRGCPIGNLALEVSNDMPRVRRLLEANFEGWKEAIVGFLQPAKKRFKRGTGLKALADYALTVMEGGILLARSRRSIEPYDAAVRMLREHFEGLLK